MKTLLSALSLLFFLPSYSTAQEFVTDLYGFRLGQYRETSQNQFGKPPLMHNKYQDNFEYEVHLVKPDTTMYMTFEYAAGMTDIIWAIQVSGNDSTADLKFKDLKFGMHAAAIESRLGKPTKKVDVGQYGERWEFGDSNYTIELDKHGKLSSIKISDTHYAEQPQMNTIPSFQKITTALTSGDNREIASILAPTVEVYHNGKTVFFSKSIEFEINTDHSQVFHAVKSMAPGLEKVNPKDPAVYEENLRTAQGQAPLHVVKIKSGHVIREMVLKYINGTFLIWEIKTH